MTGMTQDGRATGRTKRQASRSVPNGPLTRHHVRDFHEAIARNMKAEGYTAEQIAQVIGRTRRTVERYPSGISPQPV